MLFTFTYTLGALFCKFNAMFKTAGDQTFNGMKFQKLFIAN